MSEREDAHKFVDYLPEMQLSALLVLLGSIVEPEVVALGNALFDDEPETDAERLAVAQARASREKNGGKSVPHNEAMRLLGLEWPQAGSKHLCQGCHWRAKDSLPKRRSHPRSGGSIRDCDSYRVKTSRHCRQSEKRLCKPSRAEAGVVRK